MEIRDQCIHCLDSDARLDKNLGKTAPCMNHAGIICHRFQCPYTGRSHTDDPPSAISGRVDPLRLLLRYLIIFTVHVMIIHVFLFHRPERSKADVKKHWNDIDSLFPDAVKEFRRKVQAGRRRRRASVRFGINRLVPVAVLQPFMDIRRERHLSEFIQDLLEDPIPGETDRSAPVLPDTQNRCLQFSFPKDELRTGLCPFPGFQNHFPVRQVQPLQQKELNCAARFCLHAVKPGRNDSCFIDDQHIPRIQILNDIPENPVLNGVLFPVNHHQAGTVPGINRFLCNQFLRQVIIEITGLHSSFLHPAWTSAPAARCPEYTF